MRIGDPHSEAGALAQCLLDHRPQMMEIDHDVLNAVTLQEQQIPDNHGSTGDREERLRHHVGERPQPGSEARCENHGLHSRDAVSTAALSQFSDVWRQALPERGQLGILREVAFHVA